MRLLRVILIACTAGTATFACASSSGGNSGPLECDFQQTELMCSGTCYAAGEFSTCPNGGLCVGDETGLTCASNCTQDIDCPAHKVCMQGCAIRAINHYCVTPDFRDATLASSECTTPNNADSIVSD